MANTALMGSILRILGLVTTVAVLLTAYTPLPNAVARRVAVVSRVNRGDAIVVLGASVYRDGTLSDPSIRRMMVGLLLYHQGWAPLLVLSGPSYAGSPVEAEVRAEWAKQLGVPSRAILLETRAQTTAEEASNIATTLRQRGAKRILLVSDTFHLARAVPAFEKERLIVWPAAADSLPLNTENPDSRLSLSIRTLREAIARWLYSLGE